MAVEDNQKNSVQHITKETPQQKHKESDRKENISVDVFDQQVDLCIGNNTTGRQLFEQVVEHIGLREVWFFGLEYEDTKGQPTWLRLKKKVFSQDVGKQRPVHLKLKPKFYPEDVEKELNHIIVKHLLLEHTRREIVSGELVCAADTAVLLASLALQAQLGNHNPVLSPRGFLLTHDKLPAKLMEQYPLSEQAWEDKIVTLYKDHMGMNRELATVEYLRIAQDLEMFGVTYFRIRNKKQASLYLGIDALGLNVYEKNNKLEPIIGFPWNEIKAISYRGKQFTIKPIDEKSPNFVFYVERIRLNKEILALCIGNHELYIRRRKVDVAPSERSSVASRTLQTQETPKSQSDAREQELSSMPKETEASKAVLEQPSSTPKEDRASAVSESSKKAVDKPPRKISTSKKKVKIASESKHEQERIESGEHNKESSNDPAQNGFSNGEIPSEDDMNPRYDTINITTESVPRTDSLDSLDQRYETTGATVPEPNERNIDSEMKKRRSPPGIPQSNTSSTTTTEPLYATVRSCRGVPALSQTPGHVDKNGHDNQASVESQDSDSDAEEITQKDPYISQTVMEQNSLYERIGNSSLQTLTELSEEGSDSRFRVSESIEMRRGSRQYEALLARYKNGLVAAPEPPPRTNYAPENSDPFVKAKSLFEGLVASDCVRTEVDQEHGTENRHGQQPDKYQTLRKIRSGFARDRVAIFEALM